MTDIGASPSDLLETGHFLGWYPGQQDLLLESLQFYYSTSQFLGVSLPTGGGKSLVALLLAKMTGARTVILTATKGLAKQYCVSPETKTLTVDLRWIPVGSVSVGDLLLAFDENGRVGSHRKWQVAAVSAVSRVKLPCYRLTFDDGAVIVCSSEHPWLVAGGKKDGTMRFWRTTENLRVGGRFASKVIRFADVWETDGSREAGYLAGAFDGEGCLSQGLVNRSYADGHAAVGARVSLTFSQNPGKMLDEVKRLLILKGFMSRERGHSSRDKCHILHVHVRSNVLRFLGQVRPTRLLDRFDPFQLGSVYDLCSCKLIAREFVGDQEVVALSTTTGTFLADGLAAHNCRDAYAIGGVEVKGRNNFPCLLDPSVTAEEGVCNLGLVCDLRDECPYRLQLETARRSGLVVTNYAYWLAQTNYTDGLGPVSLLVCDEAHLAFGALESFLTVYIARSDIQPLGLTFPATGPEQWQGWRLWAESALELAEGEASRLSTKVRSARRERGTLPSALVHAARRASALHSKLKLLSGLDEQWVVQWTLNGCRFIPKWVSQHSDDLFHTADVPKIVLMSAILSRRTLDYLGVPENCDWIEAESAFPPGNTPIVHVDTTRINYHTGDMDTRVWVSRIDQIIQRRLDRKGIVFTVSYERAKLLLSRSRFKDIMITHSTRDVIDAVDMFKNSSPPIVLVSPAVTTGYDFPMQEKPYYLIVGKLPYPDTSEPVTKARHEDDKDWSSYIAMETLIQESGRATRGVDEKSEVLIVDDNIVWFMKKYGLFAPAWFRARYKGSFSTVPDPLV